MEKKQEKYIHQDEAKEGKLMQQLDDEFIEVLRDIQKCVTRYSEDITRQEKVRLTKWVERLCSPTFRTPAWRRNRNLHAKYLCKKLMEGTLLDDPPFDKCPPANEVLHNLPFDIKMLLNKKYVQLNEQIEKTLPSPLKYSYQLSQPPPSRKFFDSFTNNSPKRVVLVPKKSTEDLKKDYELSSPRKFLDDFKKQSENLTFKRVKVKDDEEPIEHHPKSPRCMSARSTMSRLSFSPNSKMLTEKFSHSNPNPDEEEEYNQENDDEGDDSEKSQKLEEEIEQYQKNYSNLDRHHSTGMNESFEDDNYRPVRNKVLNSPRNNSLSVPKGSASSNNVMALVSPRRMRTTASAKNLNEQQNIPQTSPKNAPFLLIPPQQPKNSPSKFGQKNLPSPGSENQKTQMQQFYSPQGKVSESKKLEQELGMMRTLIQKQEQTIGALISKVHHLEKKASPPKKGKIPSPEFENENLKASNKNDNEMKRIVVNYRDAYSNSPRKSASKELQEPSEDHHYDYPELLVPSSPRIQSKKLTSPPPPSNQKQKLSPYASQLLKKSEMQMNEYENLDLMDEEEEEEEEEEDRETQDEDEKKHLQFLREYNSNLKAMYEKFKTSRK